MATDAPALSLDERLILAVREGRAADVRRLLDEGASPRATAKRDGEMQWEVPVLVSAAMRGHTEIALLLLERGAAIDDAPVAYHAGIFTEEPMTTPGPTALWVAAARGDRPLVDVLLRHGATIDARNENSPERETPLVAAAEGGHVEVLETLLDAGAATRGVADAAARAGQPRVLAFLSARGLEPTKREAP